VILASASPRRAGILEALGIEFEVCPADVEETVIPGETPEGHALRLAESKAKTVGGLYPSASVLGGDTLVTIDGEILGKPRDDEDAVAMLMRLRGRTHQVVSALALESSNGEGPRVLYSGAQVTGVTFVSFPIETARAYVDTGEPEDKAGGYGIQGKGAALVERIEGDYTGVVGLPVPLLLRLLEEAGQPYRFPPQAAQG
jgi:septum formation protein